LKTIARGFFESAKSAGSARQFEAARRCGDSTT
jgi:hypothetical protein